MLAFVSNLTLCFILMCSNKSFVSIHLRGEFAKFCGLKVNFLHFILTYISPGHLGLAYFSWSVRFMVCGLTPAGAPKIVLFVSSVTMLGYA
jgi:hypothetical protein